MQKVRSGGVYDGYPPTEGDVAECSGCGRADDNRRADCCDHSLASGGERVQLYRAVRDVQSAVDACVDKCTLQKSEGDPVAYKQ